MCWWDDKLYPINILFLKICLQSDGTPEKILLHAIWGGGTPYTLYFHPGQNPDLRMDENNFGYQFIEPLTPPHPQKRGLYLCGQVGGQKNGTNRVTIWLTTGIITWWHVLRMPWECHASKHVLRHASKCASLGHPTAASHAIFWLRMRVFYDILQIRTPIVRIWYLWHRIPAFYPIIWPTTLEFWATHVKLHPWVMLNWLSSTLLQTSGTLAQVKGTPH